MRMRIDRIKLAAALKYKNITQIDLASRSGLSRITVNTICNGKSCTEKSAEKIAEALEMPLTSITEN